MKDFLQWAANPTSEFPVNLLGVQSKPIKKRQGVFTVLLTWCPIPSLAHAGSTQRYIPALGRERGCEPSWGKMTKWLPTPAFQPSQHGKGVLEVSLFWEQWCLGTVPVLCAACSQRGRNVNCNKELAHAYLQLKPKQLLLEITSIWLLSNTGCKWDGFPECHVFTWWHIQNFWKEVF